MRPQWKNKWLTILFLLAGFCAGVLFVVTATPWWMAYLRVRHWVSVEAEVHSAWIIDVDPSNPHSMLRHGAQYSFIYNGRQWNGDRVSIDPEYRSQFSEFSKLLCRGISTARYQGHILESVSFEGLHVTVPAWVNPDDPNESMLYRDAGMSRPIFCLAVGVPLSLAAGSLLGRMLLARRRGSDGDPMIGPEEGTLTRPPEDCLLERRGDGMRMTVPESGNGGLVTTFEVSGSPGPALRIRQESPSKNTEREWTRDEIAFIGVHSTSAGLARPTFSLYVRGKGRKVENIFIGRNEFESQWVKKELQRALGLGTKQNETGDVGA